MMHFEADCRDSIVGRCRSFCVIAIAWFFSGDLQTHCSVVAAADQPQASISFVNDIVPVLTKAGCNSGVCHAKAGGGQNGFQLSLLGFEPREDYDHLVREGRGRRLFPAAPDESLLLLKASGQKPHGGGVRLSKDSQGYRQLRDWIAAGAPYGQADAPKLLSIEVQPAGGLLQQGTTQQLTTLAHYSDNAVRDVTELALYEPNDRAMVEVTEAGLVKAFDLPGVAAVMIRYQGKVTVFNAAIPLGAAVEQVPASKNFIDDHVFSNLKTLGIPPSSLCDDATYLRRVTLDIAGRLPTEAEAREFLANQAEHRRDQVVKKLLQSSAYADYFANKWTSLLKNRRDDASDITSNFAFHAWLRDSLLANQPYDQIVRELLAATGTVIGNPPVLGTSELKNRRNRSKMSLSCSSV